jgi:hypothetical protein
MFSRALSIATLSSRIWRRIIRSAGEASFTIRKTAPTSKDVIILLDLRIAEGSRHCVFVGAGCTVTGCTGAKENPAPCARSLATSAGTVIVPSS